MLLPSQNISIKKLESKLENTKSLKLISGQATLLSAPSPKRRCIAFSFDKGIARFSSSFDDHYDDITLGFCGQNKSEWLRLPIASSLLLEAMNDCVFSFKYEEECPIHQDLMMQWLFDLHLVRHPVGSDVRLEYLFRLLVRRFGVRHRNSGYLLLPFNLSHSRIAELIGTTRSTVTRHITRLRQEKLILLDEGNSNLMLSKNLIKIPNH